MIDAVRQVVREELSPSRTPKARRSRARAAVNLAGREHAAG
jgi:hypothetical protein